MNKAALNQLLNANKAASKVQRAVRDKHLEQVKSMDAMQQSRSDATYDKPLIVPNLANGTMYEVLSASRKGTGFQVKYKVDSVEKSFNRHSPHCSGFKLVELFGLSIEAKRLYRDLEIYDRVISCQANLTTTRWNQSIKQIDQTVVTVESDFDTDLIFTGSLINSTDVEGLLIRIYANEDSVNYPFISQYQSLHAGLERSTWRSRLHKSMDDVVQAYPELHTPNS